MKKSIRNVFFAAILSTAVTTPMFAGVSGGIPRPDDTASNIIFALLNVLGL